MKKPEKIMQAVFYKTESGTEPVRDWLADLTKEDKKAIGNDIKTVEYGWPLGMPLCRKITGYKGLWEVRTALSKGRIARVFWCAHDGMMILLHGFIKKAQKTPKTELEVAADRQKSIK